MRREPVHHTIVAMDVAGFGHRDDVLQLRMRAEQIGLAPEEFLRRRVEQLLDRPDEPFRQAATYVLQKNAELYRQLA